MNDESIALTLAARPDWAKLNAYERTKLACQELTRAGAAIPAWTALRDIIRKGSSGDINRAKKDFRLEHAEALRKMEGFSADGVPPALTPHILGMWTEAISQAKASFSDQVRIWEEAVEQSDRALQDALADLELAQSEVQTMLVRAEGADQARAALMDQVSAEQAARKAAESMLGEIRADANLQRDRLDAALKHSQSELDKAISRLEASERRSLLEVERARQEASQKVAQATGLLNDAKAKYELELHRLSKRIQDEGGQNTNLRSINSKLEHAVREATSRAERAEASLEELQAQNAKLLKALGDKPWLRRSLSRKRPAGEKVDIRSLTTDKSR